LQTPPCGLPPFVDQLDDYDQQKQLRDIWSNYKDGNKCDYEHRLTVNLVQSLSRDQFERIFFHAHTDQVSKVEI
jgi:hypothetical protein